MFQEVLDVNWNEPFESNAIEEKIAPEYLTCLHKCFGHSSFRKTQWKVINSIMNDRRDNCVIMATGYGKSLCFQFPSVYLDTITIVISPLISLMQDQVLGMKLNKLRACFLGSAQENRETVTDIINRKFNIVYATPEYITSEAGQYLLNKIRAHLSLIAIDEAHCISKWGHEFRFAYRSLCMLRDVCPEVPILAMTATATPQVRDDIVQSLKLRDAQVISTGFDRPNLEIAVKQKSTSPWTDIGQHITNVKIGSVIVYCMTRRITEEIAASIEANGHPCGRYHAGLSLSLRKKTHEDFIHDRIRVICATIAFGMGINKPDVRLVIHYGVSKDLESYYQEVGRAGRDGLPSKCLMFYEKKDWALIEFIRSKTKVSEAQEENQAKLLDVVRRYVFTDGCRRRFILSYFGEDCSGLPVRSNCCDNCKASNTSTNMFSRYEGLCEDGKLDITDESMKLLQFVSDNNGRLGSQKIILILRGSKSKSAPEQCFKHRLYGSLSAKSAKWLEAVADYLLTEGFIKTHRKQLPQMGRSYSTWAISEKGTLQLISKSPIRINPTDEFIRSLKIKVPKLAVASRTPVIESQAPPVATTTTFEAPAPALHDIYRPLLKVRTTLATLFDVMPYLVASTKALQQLANNQPTSMEELRKLDLDGYSEEKIERFGPAFLKVIKDFHAKLGKSEKKDEIATITRHLVVSGDFKSDSPSFSSKNAVVVKEEECQSPNLLGLEANGTNPSHGREDTAEEEPSISSQGSVEILEPSPAPIIDISSDTEEEFNSEYNWESDLRNSELIRAAEVVQNQSSDSDCKNEELDLFIAALKADGLCFTQEAKQIENEENIEPICKTNTKNPKVNGGTLQDYAYTKPATITPIIKQTEPDIPTLSKCPSDVDLFDECWDSDIDDRDLTQISEKAEHDAKASSPPDEASSPNQTAPWLCLEPIVTLREDNSGSNLLCAPANGTTEAPQKINHKARVIQKCSTAFEYEDDSSSDSDQDAKRLTLPKKRSLPSWMQLSSRKRR